MTLRALLTALLCAAAMHDALAAARIEQGTDEQAQLPYWQINDEHMSLRLVQRQPDQTRGFFTARGFTASQAELIAQSCVFQTVFKNESHHSQPAPLEYNLREWVVTVNGETRGLKTREDWKTEWQRQGVAVPVQLAFQWSLYPTQQVYQPGDYNWGMSIFNLKPGTLFDLTVVWRQHGTTHEAAIRGMQCAPDTQP